MGFTKTEYPQKNCDRATAETYTEQSIRAAPDFAGLNGERKGGLPPIGGLFGWMGGLACPPHTNPPTGQQETYLLSPS